MKITLETVRNVLRAAFGQDSFIASFITNAHASDNCPSAGINAQGVMQYNPQFAAEHVTSKESLFCLVTHELMHRMFGHFIYQSGQLENIAGDTVINATISVLFARASGGGVLFKKFYQDHGLEGLLRPGSQMWDSRYTALYRAFYGHGASNLSTGEVIEALRILTPHAEATRIVLLGTHPSSSDGAGSNGLERLSPDALSRIAEDLKQAAKLPTGQMAGQGQLLHELLLDALRTHLSIRKVLLQRFATTRKMDRFKQAVHQPRLGVSPIPLCPSKRDLVLLSAGVAPFHYHNRVQRASRREQGLAIYLDVSGSVNQHLPGIIGVLQSLSADLLTIFLFSTEVVETPFKTLLKGRVETTFGTSFDCIAESVIDRNLDKAVILTDGYASLRPELQQELKKRRFHTLTVLFAGKTDCPEFAQFGDVLQLEDITH